MAEAIDIRALNEHHLRIVSDVPIQEYRTGAVVTRCNIEKSAHRHTLSCGLPRLSMMRK